MAFILDTDTLSIFLKQSQPAYARLEARLSLVPSEDLTTTVVNYQENVKGWLGALNRPKDKSQILRAYRELADALRFFCRLKLLPFDEGSQDRFDTLRRQGVRIGTLDLRIASIALTTGCTLVSRNLKDFQKVPGLQVEDWTK